MKKKTIIFIFLLLIVGSIIGGPPYAFRRLIIKLDSDGNVTCYTYKGNPTDPRFQTIRVDVTSACQGMIDEVYLLLDNVRDNSRGVTDPPYR